MKLNFVATMQEIMGFVYENINEIFEQAVQENGQMTVSLNTTHNDLMRQI